MRILASLFLLLALINLSAVAAEKNKNSNESEKRYEVIINPKNPIEKLNAEDVAAIFLGKKKSWDGKMKIQPVMLSEKHPVTRLFIEQVMGKNAVQYRKYWWRNRTLSKNVKPPKTFGTSKEVVDFSLNTLERSVL